MNFIKEWSGTVAVVIAAITLFVVLQHGHAFGAVDTTCQGYTTCLNDLYVTTAYGGTGSLTTVGTTTVGNTATISYFTLGGAQKASIGGTLNTATSSSPIIIRNPWFGTATSSIDKALVNITTGVTGTNKYDISTTTNCTGGNASSTPALVYDHSVSTGAQDNLVWTPFLYASTSKVFTAGTLFSDSGNSEGKNPFILAPSECISLRVATSSPGTFTSFWVGTYEFDFSRL